MTDDFTLWKEELIVVDYLHECPDGAHVTMRLAGSDQPVIHLDSNRCAGCGEQPMLMRKVEPEELTALNVGLWPGLPNDGEN